MFIFDGKCEAHRAGSPPSIPFQGCWHSATCCSPATCYNGVAEAWVLKTLIDGYYREVEAVVKEAALVSAAQEAAAKMRILHEAMDSARLASKEGGLSRGTGGLMTQVDTASASAADAIIALGQAKVEAQDAAARVGKAPGGGETSAMRVTIKEKSGTLSILASSATGLQGLGIDDIVRFDRITVGAGGDVDCDGCVGVGSREQSGVAEVADLARQRRPVSSQLVNDQYVNKSINQSINQLDLGKTWQAKMDELMDVHKALPDVVAELRRLDPEEKGSKGSSGSKSAKGGKKPKK
eukprot:symbB.v1.2.019109.t1/scaffold1551.1/size112226/4